MIFSEKIVAEKLAERQKEIGSHLRVFCVEETQSTNADAARMLAAGTPPGNFAICANAQTAGRGRVSGRKWESPPGNILLTVAFRPENLAPARLANFTLWLGVCVAEMLRKKFAVPAQVKWPNDIFCREKKMAGMLTEAHMDSARVHGIIFGIGLNVNLSPEQLPENLRDSATSLRTELGTEKIDVNAACAELLLAIENAYAEFLAGTHSEKLAEIWREYDFLAGKNVVAKFADEKILGIADGINAQGCIKITDVSGQTRLFAAGDISLKKKYFSGK